MKLQRSPIAAAFACLLGWHLSACKKVDTSMSDQTAGGGAAALSDVTADVFKAMDGSIELGEEEIRGRNMWILWTGGNEQFWDRMARESFGLVDLLKTLDSRQRGERFQKMGLINDPGFKKAGSPDPYGLWLDERVEDEPPGVDPEVYGRASGVMGFRLFPNPDFDTTAAKEWNAERFYAEPEYAANPSLVRPYRVGITCGSCHIGFHPLNPPSDPANPRWENLASAIGNQYLREGSVFATNAQSGGFFAEMLKAQPPGTADTSRVATDNINNPICINPVFLLGSREATAQTEYMHPDFMLLPNQSREMKVPRFGADGADAIGAPGFILRKYVNMGMFSQHWLLRHQPLLGLTPQMPFSIKAGRKYSSYWVSTESRLGNIVRFLRRLAPMRLSDAPGGRGFIDAGKVPRGRQLFAQQCATCHSSKQPPENVEVADWFSREVERPGFLTDNFFANEKRIAACDIKTNSAGALGSNGMRGHIWDVFTSETYKVLASPGEMQLTNALNNRTERFLIPRGGPGYLRSASLISLWTSAPFLHNNSLGKFTGDPSVKGRLEAFDDAMEKLLWPEKRDGLASIWRTSQPSTLALPAAAIPDPFRTLLKPHTDADGVFRVGPIPRGMPVNLLANVNPEVPPGMLVEIFVNLKKILAELKAANLDEAGTADVIANKIAPLLLKVTKSPELIEDSGHTFGAELPDDDKRALIEFLKTI